MCLTKKTHVVENHPSISYSIVREVNVNESTIKYTQKNEVGFLGSLCEAGLEKANVTPTVF